MEQLGQMESILSLPAPSRKKSSCQHSYQWSLPGKASGEGAANCERSSEEMEAPPDLHTSTVWGEKGKGSSARKEVQYSPQSAVSVTCCQPQWENVKWTTSEINNFLSFKSHAVLSGVMKSCGLCRPGGESPLCPVSPCCPCLWTNDIVCFWHPSIDIVMAGWARITGGRWSSFWQMVRRATVA